MKSSSPLTRVHAAIVKREEDIIVLSNILHEYIQDCEEDPLGGQPEARRGRKRIYAERIIDFLTPPTQLLEGEIITKRI